MLDTTMYIYILELSTVYTETSIGMDISFKTCEKQNHAIYSPVARVCMFGWSDKFISSSVVTL